MSEFSRFLLCNFGQIWKWSKHLNFVPFIKKTHENHVYNRIWSFWITLTFLQSRKTSFKVSQFSRFLLRHSYAILVKIWKWLKLLIFPFIKKTHVNHVCNRIWSFWMTFTFLESRKANFKMSQFLWCLLSHGYAILVRIWKWPKLLNFVPFIKKTHVNHVYSRIWWFLITLTFLQSRKKNFKMSQFSRFLPKCGYATLVKIFK